MNQAPKSQPPNMILLCQDRLLLELIGEGKESLEKALMVDFTWDILGMFLGCGEVHWYFDQVLFMMVAHNKLAERLQLSAEIG